MKIVAIAGCSGAGKSVLARAIDAAVGKCSVIEMDSYYWPQTELSVEERAITNYDHPDSLDWLLLEQHLEALRRGETAEIPEYDFTQHTRKVTTTAVEPRGIVLVEGILALHRAEIRVLADVRVYVDAAADACYVRRIARDTAERGRTEESVIEQYYATVLPMSAKYVLPSRAHADLVVSGERPVGQAVEAIRARLGPIVPA
jgi:uridine kinase